MNSTNTVAVFKSNVVEEINETAERVRDGEPLGKACAEFIAAMLSEKGVFSRGPIAGELSWFMYPMVGDCECKISVSWATPLEHEEDLWMLNVHSRPSLLERLTKRHKHEDAIKKLLEVLARCFDEILRAQIVSDVTWMSEGEFWDQFAT